MSDWLSAGGLQHKRDDGLQRRHSFARMIASKTRGVYREPHIHGQSREIQKKTCSDVIGCYGYDVNTATDAASASVEQQCKNADKLLGWAVHTHTRARARACACAHPFNGPSSGTTRVSRYHNGKTKSGFY